MKGFFMSISPVERTVITDLNGDGRKEELKFEIKEGKFHLKSFEIKASPGKRHCRMQPCPTAIGKGSDAYTIDRDTEIGGNPLEYIGLRKINSTDSFRTLDGKTATQLHYAIVGCSKGQCKMFSQQFVGYSISGQRGVEDILDVEAGMDLKIQSKNDAYQMVSQLLTAALTSHPHIKLTSHSKGCFSMSGAALKELNGLGIIVVPNGILIQHNGHRVNITDSFRVLSIKNRVSEVMQLQREPLEHNLLDI